VPLAVVTGAGSGIGRATALALARHGLDVALVGRTEASLRATAGAIALTGVRTLVALADVSVGVDVTRAAGEIARAMGTPQVVVNNAGVAGRRARIEQLGEDEWDAVLGPNLKGLFLVTRALLPAMRAAGTGRLVTIASISSTLGSPGLAPYAASKWGAVGFTKSLAEELRGTGLQALAVLPGSVDTPMVNVGGFAPQMSPEDVAGLVVYAALDAPAAMNGSAIECFGP
jgi:NAD(P)-dependent dehydrogenase (short-subunit alcohol dehydrogenase family)